MREIITLQLGHLSNYVATHFWNAQESYFTYDGQERSAIDHNVHWRAGLGQDGSETFLPRTVIYDLKGGFGSLRKINPLYDAAPDADAASYSLCQLAIHKQEAIGASVYQRSLDAGAEPACPDASTVRYWSDFSRVFYHPKSQVQLYDYELDSAIRPFERFASGTELFDSLDKEHDIVDRDWRPFVEECDAMQGMQVVTTLDDAWGGFASSYLEALRDEYPKSCIWVWGIQNTPPRAPRSERQMRLVNAAQSLTRACASATTVVPLAVPNGPLPGSLAVDRDSFWHVSGLLSTAIESATLPARLTSGPGQRPASLSDMAEGLITNGKQVLASARMTVGERAADAKMLDLSSLVSSRDGSRVDDERSNDHVFGEHCVHRGIEDGEVVAVDEVDFHQKRVIGDSLIRRQVYTSPSSWLRLTSNDRYTSSTLFPLLTSFPPIYPQCQLTDSAISVRAILSTNSSMAAHVKALRLQASRSFFLDERETLVSDLLDIADAYHHGWSSDSDEGDDDL
ncbi:hypothetical protein HIM_04524 [Hirsutella minnesotensis 3608]|uniref:Protein DML1 n=1 Tax=Hirsutella minnesotensis 3608 TaxID=1043627 RepID=A0A0F7ZV64_9HYPO|nr:hypothetical protein HIM_04524 [Hirsutella minnesotensis 3608]